MHLLLVGAIVLLPMPNWGAGGLSAYPRWPPGHRSVGWGGARHGTAVLLTRPSPSRGPFLAQ